VGLQSNYEVKARCSDLAAARAAVIRLGARPAEVVNQTDTFFDARRGRLKLREVEGRAAELIWYDRPNRTGPRLSSYHLVPVADGPGLRAALAAALGLGREVRKRREVLLWENVRIHLDEVDGLGTFVEFEAVLGPGETLDTSRERLDQLVEAVRVRLEDKVGQAYADLLSH
jgi:adenylate cyclase class IV